MPTATCGNSNLGKIRLKEVENKICTCVTSTVEHDLYLWLIVIDIYQFNVHVHPAAGVLEEGLRVGE